VITQTKYGNEAFRLHYKVDHCTSELDVSCSLSTAACFRSRINSLQQRPFWTRNWRQKSQRPCGNRTPDIHFL